MIIYKITNKINGCVYIGKTKQSVEARWKQHCRDANSRIACFKLQKAIKEFGAENFTAEQIDCASSPDEANAKEVYWIKFYNSTENGYNTSKGGKHSGANKKVVCVETGEVFDSIIDASKHIGVSHGAINPVIDKPHLKCGGYHWKSLSKKP